MQNISYVSQCLKNNTIVRWPDNCMPLTIFIAPFKWYKEKNNSFAYKQLVFDALNVWTQASGGKISFNVVNNINESQINLIWKRVERTSLGHCYLHFDNKSRIFSAEIQIGLSDGVIHTQYQDKNEVFHTIIHEVGHSLGLGHSPYKNDIMYVPHQYGVTAVSKRDKNTLKWLYNLPYGMTSAEILAKHNLSSDTDLDYLIYKLENGNKISDKKEFEILNTQETKDLEEERQLLAEINKYNMALQKINLSPGVKNYIKKHRIIDKNK